MTCWTSWTWWEYKSCIWNVVMLLRDYTGYCLDPMTTVRGVVLGHMTKEIPSPFLCTVGQRCELEYILQFWTTAVSSSMLSHHYESIAAQQVGLCHLPLWCYSWDQSATLLSWVGGVFCVSSCSVFESLKNGWSSHRFTFSTCQHKSCSIFLQKTSENFLENSLL